MIRAENPSDTGTASEVFSLKQGDRVNVGNCGNPNGLHLYQGANTFSGVLVKPDEWFFNIIQYTCKHRYLNYLVFDPIIYYRSICLIDLKTRLKETATLQKQSLIVFKITTFCTNMTL